MHDHSPSDFSIMTGFGVSFALLTHTISTPKNKPSNLVVSEVEIFHSCIRDKIDSSQQDRHLDISTIQYIRIQYSQPGPPNTELALVFHNATIEGSSSLIQNPNSKSYKEKYLVNYSYSRKSY